MISYDLRGKTALVTGAASGIGFATARMLVLFGATVAVNYLPDDPRGPEAVDKLNAGEATGVPGKAAAGANAGGKAIGAPGSVGDRGAAERMVRQAIDDLGRLDLLFNNAGTPGTRRRIAPAELDLVTEDLWSQLLETNLLGVFRCSKAAAPALKAAKGAVVNTASIAGLGRAGSSLAYSATKAGVVSLTQNLDGGMDQRGTPAVHRARLAEAPLPAGRSGRGRVVPRLRRGDGDRADDHGGRRTDAVTTGPADRGVTPAPAREPRVPAHSAAAAGPCRSRCRSVCG